MTSHRFAKYWLTMILGAALVILPQPPYPWSPHRAEAGTRQAAKKHSKTKARSKYSSKQWRDLLAKTMLGQPIPTFRKTAKKRKYRHNRRRFLKHLRRYVSRAKVAKQKPRPRAIASRGGARALRIHRQSTSSYRPSVRNERWKVHPSTTRRARRWANLSSHRSLYEQTLTYKRLRRLLRRNHKQLQYCYNRALKRNPRLKGEFRLRLTISTQGKAKNIRFVKSKMNKTVLRCIQKTMRRWRYPKAKKQSVTYEVPLLFVVRE